MPQIMPINWLLSFFFFICIFIIFNIMNFYIFNYNFNKNSNFYNFKLNNKNILWKW